MQQGRVQIDADWNEQVDIENYYNRLVTSDIIGNHGVPIAEKDGFRIEPQDNSYLIRKGRYYVDGIVCENEKDREAFEQPDLPPIEGHSPCPLSPGVYAMYLDVWERHLTYLDDSSIRDIALGGIDTSTRSKIIWQVKPLRIGDIGDNTRDISSSIWLSLKEESSGTLQVRYGEGGYTGFENVLYRVEIHDGGIRGSATFKWSRENGTVVTKVSNFSPLENKMSVDDDAKDMLLNFAPGQWVEVIDDRHELWGIPGTMFRLQDIKNNIISIEKDTIKGSPLTNATYPQEFHPKVRRWDSSEGFVTVNEDSYIELENGIQVKFGAGIYRTGDYWLIPSRTALGDIEWPKREECPIAMPPDGIIHHYCPLALVEFNQNKIKLITDYRRSFETIGSITNKLSAHSGTSSIILQPMKFKMIGPIQHKCNLANIHPVPPLVMLGLESSAPSSSLPNSQDCSTILHMEDLSLLPLLSNRYGQVAGESKESEELAGILGLGGYLKTMSEVPPFFKPVSIDTQKFYILVVNYNKIQLTLSLRWWAIPVN